MFVCAFLGGAAALCLAVAVSAHDDEQRRWSIGVGLASAGAGIAFALLLDALPAPMVSVCSGGLLGFGLTCLLRQWGRFYRSFTFQGALLNTGLSNSCQSFIFSNAMGRRYCTKRPHRYSLRNPTRPLIIPSRRP